MALMEEFTLFRLFLAFPLIGLSIPDIGLAFSGNGIPATHLIIEITLLLCIAVCSLGIRYFKRKEIRKIAAEKALVSVL
jgi:hypothetical protein